jgi:acyl carrier protein
VITTGFSPAPSAQEPSTLSDTERIVADIWREILELSQQPAPSDTFFELGGDSLTMTLMLFRIAEQFGTELPPAALLEKPDLRAFSALLDSAAK